MDKFLEYWPLLLSAVLFLISLCIFLHWNNTALQVTEYTLCSERLPESFDGYRIVQISDLHNTAFGKDNCHLLEKIRALNPDLIAITGDIVQSRPMDKALAFARQAAEIAPVYYVPGNHEHRMDYETLYVGLRTAGATLLLNQRITIAKDGGQICLVGVEDPIFCPDASMEETLLPLIDDTYTVVLSHRPEYFDTYVSVAADLVLTGHAHGGQFRLPFIGGIFVPNQGLFPKYDAGLFVEGQTHMIISRGLGNSAFPFRLNNRPEIVAVTLKTAR